MFSGLAKSIDWIAIQLALSSVRNVVNQRELPPDLRSLLKSPCAWLSAVVPEVQLKFSDATHFQFLSPITSPWPENNQVCGRFHACGEDWRNQPTVVLVHGWNSERNYDHLFPWLAGELNRRGLNALFALLPYHGIRKPKTPGAVTNYISDDLTTMLEATRQAIAETRALIAWARAQGTAPVTLWGISLGGWLSGLTACLPAPPDALVLMTPLCKMSRAAAELAFCWPLKQALERHTLTLDTLDLIAFQPTLAPDKILIVESRHDLLAPPETVEELWRAWQQPEIWRLAQGHISILISPAIMRRTVKWIADRVAPSTISGQRA